MGMKAKEASKESRNWSASLKIYKNRDSDYLKLHLPAPADNRVLVYDS